MIRRATTTSTTLLAPKAAAAALGRRHLLCHRSNRLLFIGNNKVSSTAAAAVISTTTSNSSIIDDDFSPVLQQYRYYGGSSHSCIGGGARFFSSQPAAVPDGGDDDDDDEIPSNLIFDVKSSFAPKPKPKVPLVVVVPDENDEEAEGEEAEGEGEDIEDVVDDEEYDDDYGIDFEDDDDIVDDNIMDNNIPRYVIPLPDRLKVDIRQGLSGENVGTIWLEESIFGIDEPRIDLIKQNVVYIRNKIRGRRKAKTKTISEKSGSGRKVRQQKGTGSARAGHSRPAHWRGGAKAHGPKNTVDYGNVKMNKKQKRLAICNMLSQKLKEGNVIVVDNFNLKSHKTSPWSKLLSDVYGVGKEKTQSSAFILDHYLNNSEESEEESMNDSQEKDDDDASYQGVPINLWVASSNIPKIKIANQQFCNTYDIILKDKLILTLNALKEIESRWKH